MNPVFRLILGTFTGLYRLTNGKIGGTMVGLGVLLLTTTGRLSGKERTTPLGYFEEGQDLVIIASNGGADKHPAWFWNLKSNPNVKVRIKDTEFSATAEISDPETRGKLWQKLISLSPYYIKYGDKTKRRIPMILLHHS